LQKNAKIAKTAISETREKENFGKRKFPKLAKTKILEKTV